MEMEVTSAARSGSDRIGSGSCTATAIGSDDKQHRLVEGERGSSAGDRVDPAKKDSDQHAAAAAAVAATADLAKKEASNLDGTAGDVDDDGMEDEEEEQPDTRSSGRQFSSIFGDVEERLLSYLLRNVFGCVAVASAAEAEAAAAANAANDSPSQQQQQHPQVVSSAAAQQPPGREEVATGAAATAISPGSASSSSSSSVASTENSAQRNRNGRPPPPSPSRMETIRNALAASSSSRNLGLAAGDGGGATSSSANIGHTPFSAAEEALFSERHELHQLKEQRRLCCPDVGEEDDEEPEPDVVEIDIGAIGEAAALCAGENRQQQRQAESDSLS